MKNLGEFMQTSDWKKEKHVPVIECPDSVKTGERFDVKVVIGKEIPHPNTTEHHIRWISIFFKPDDDEYIVDLGNYEFDAHGESVKGANEGPAYTDPSVSNTVMLRKSGTLIASSYCNIHGLWQNSKPIKVQ